MGKKRSSINKNGPLAATSSHFSSITLREESSGKKQKPLNAKSMLKLDHIKNLAIWAGNEASIASLGAFFGYQLAATAEALDVQPDPSLFSWQKCESNLRPGYNCTVRIQKNKSKVRYRCKQYSLAPRNNVVYRCHFYSHLNLTRGTSTLHMKDLCPPKPKPISRPDTIQKNLKPEIVTDSKDNIIEMDTIGLQETENDNPIVHAPATPMTTVGTTLLDSKRRKMTRPGGKKAVESGSYSAIPDADNAATGASSKQRRKSWTSLKEIVDHDEQEKRRSFANSAVPCFI